MSTHAPGGTSPARPPEGVPPNRPDGDPPGRKLLLPALVMLVIIAGLTVLVAGGSSKPQLPGGATTTRTAAFEGSLVSPAQPAPPLSTLRNYQGQPVNLASYRGKAVFVTFLYTHCPDVCPLIASQLHNALSELGARASRVQLIAVSGIDPRGDKPASVATFLHAHQVAGQMQYLIGSAGELARVWSAWHVGSLQDAGNPQLVSHSALIYGVSASGKLTTIYPANFDPSQIVHDVSPLLAS